MSLPLLVAIVAVGIAAVVIAVHLTGGSASARLEGDAAARLRFLVDYPELDVRRVWRTSEGNSAVLDLADGRVGLVHAVGGKYLTRLIGAGDLAGAPRANGNSLTLRVKDFTWPGTVFEFGDAGDAAAVEALFARQRSTGIWKESR